MSNRRPKLYANMVTLEGLELLMKMALTSELQGLEGTSNFRLWLQHEHGVDRDEARKIERAVLWLKERLNSKGVDTGEWFRRIEVKRFQRKGKGQGEHVILGPRRI